MKFYQRKEIKDILCYLRVIVNHNDNEALIRVLNLTEGIGKTTLEKLFQVSKKNNKQLFDSIIVIIESPYLSSRTKSLLLKVLNFM